jgi:prepilin-type N-terminal cleavage/methylation domain-containing protein
MTDPMNQKRKHPLGFTLVELLVVIAIVAILAALTLPVLSRMRVSSLQAKGLNNVRQLHVMTMSYCADNAGRLPLGGGLLEGSSRNALSWVNRLLPYVGKSELAETNLNDWWDRPPPDPVFKDPGIDLPGEMDRLRAATVDAIWGFGYNVQPLLPESELYLADWFEQPLEGVTMAGVSKHAQRIMFGSAFDWHLVGSSENRAYHRYGKNKALAVFFDGHASVITAADYDKAFQNP